MFWNKYPYTDFHELNLDIILQLMKELHAEWDEFTAVNKITNAGAWDITKQYQAWTVVSDNNAGYISLQPVPAGVAITNTDYWGVIADYDILITDLSNRISALESDNVTNKNNITALQNKTNHIIESGLKIDNIIIVGDSYAAMTTNWYDYFVTFTGATNIYNASISGASFAATFGGTHFIDNLSGLTVTDPNAIDHVLIAGGINDCVSPVSLGDIAGAIDTMSAYIKTTYPNAKIHLAFVGNQSVNSSDVYQRTGSDIRGVIREYIAGANRNGWHYINNSEYIMKNPTFLISDGLHPTATACAAIAHYLIEGIFTGSCDVHYEINASGFTGTMATGVTKADSAALLDMIFIDNDVTTITINPHTFTFTGNTQTNDIKKLYKVFTFDGNSPVPTCDQHLGCSTTASAMSAINEGSVYFKDYAVELEICNGDFNLLTQPPLNKAGTGWGSGTINDISFAWCSIKMNTLMF